MPKQPKYLGGSSIVRSDGQWTTDWEEPPMEVTKGRIKDTPIDTRGLRDVLQRNSRKAKSPQTNRLKFKVIRAGVVIEEGHLEPDQVSKPVRTEPKKEKRKWRKSKRKLQRGRPAT